MSTTAVLDESVTTEELLRIREVTPGQRNWIEGAALLRGDEHFHEFSCRVGGQLMGYQAVLCGSSRAGPFSRVGQAGGLLIAAGAPRQTLVHLDVTAREWASDHGLRAIWGYSVRADEYAALHGGYVDPRMDFLWSPIELSRGLVDVAPLARPDAGRDAALDRINVVTWVNIAGVSCAFQPSKHGLRLASVATNGNLEPEQLFAGVQQRFQGVQTIVLDQAAAAVMHSPATMRVRQVTNTSASVFAPDGVLEPDLQCPYEHNKRF